MICLCQTSQSKLFIRRMSQILFAHISVLLLMLGGPSVFLAQDSSQWTTNCSCYNQTISLEPNIFNLWTKTNNSKYFHQLYVRKSRGLLALEPNTSRPDQNSTSNDTLTPSMSIIPWDKRKEAGIANTVLMIVDFVCPPCKGVGIILANTVTNPTYLEGLYLAYDDNQDTLKLLKHDLRNYSSSKRQDLSDKGGCWVFDKRAKGEQVVIKNSRPSTRPCLSVGKDTMRKNNCTKFHYCHTESAQQIPSCWWH